MLAYLLLAAQALGLLLTPFGWPGVWIQLASLGLYAWRTDFQLFGVVPLGLLFAASLTAELLEGTIAGGRIDAATRRRAGFAGLAGGGAGAALGLVLPLVGTLFGTVVGALLGTLLTGFRSQQERIGCAALLWQVVAMGIRTSAGVVVAVFILLTLMR